MNSDSFIPFQIQVLTPVHVGSGDVFTPLSYVVREVAPSSFQLWLIDGQGWLAASAGEEKTAEALDKGNMASLRALLNSAANIHEYILARIPIASPALGAQLFVSRLNIDKSGEIQSFIRNPFTHLPYLPASSVKGALSTPLIYYVNEKRKKRGLDGLCSDPKDKRLTRQIMEKMFGKISLHAMRSMRMGDIPLPPGSTSIRSVKGIDLDPPKIADRTPCETLDASAGIPVAGMMRLISRKGKACVSLPDNEEIHPEKLWQICREFYKERFFREFEKFYRLPHFSETGKALASLCERARNLEDDETLLRVGRYSHIECVTVSGQGIGDKKGGKSRALADGTWPFGWVILKRCSMAEYNKSQSDIDLAFRERTAKEAEITREILIRQAEAERRRKEEEDAAKKREAELAAMPWQERAILELEAAGASEEQKATSMFNKLEEYGEYKIKAAQALMAYWKRMKKWDKKDQTKKQAPKVAKVKEILGL